MLFLGVITSTIDKTSPFNISTGINANNYTTSGVYVIQSGSVYANCQNVPGKDDPANARLIIIRNTFNDQGEWWGWQFIIKDQNIYIRVHDTDSWYPWRQF